jgi:ABC-type multidrug transport system fused ATPase/permease subunit
MYLFSDTIHNNITLGNNDISREAVIEASKAIGAHAFIDETYLVITIITLEREEVFYQLDNVNF